MQLALHASWNLGFFDAWLDGNIRARNRIASNDMLMATTTQHNRTKPCSLAQILSVSSTSKLLEMAEHEQQSCGATSHMQTQMSGW